METSNKEPDKSSLLGLLSLILTGSDLLLVLILLAVDSTMPEYFLRLFPENFISTFWSFLTYGAKVSGMSTSTNKTEVSSFNIIELSIHQYHSKFYQ